MVHRQRTVYAGLILGLLSAVGLTACADEPERTTGATVPEHVDFNLHVKPILSDRCFKCHGPDTNARKADLRLDTEEGAFAALSDTSDAHAIVPGDLEASELVRRITHTDPDEQMPPPESNLALSARDIEILKRWIEQGAEWQPHWAFIPPTRPEPPAVTNTDWPRHPIDRFVLARLEREGLDPSPEASKERLIRRVTFDLTGLPPTLEEIDAFLADEAPDAYETVVDRLLASKAYGERMAVEWLDVARYADTHGYQDDIPRTMWPWRNWVIRAFNENMPFDTFTLWQIAGDLLPDASYEQILATGFNRNHMQTQEGGVIDEEYRVAYVTDRTNTTGKAFLGLTMECAACHDHKYDPISQQEYYQLFAFYNSVPERGQIPYQGVPGPTVQLPDERVEALAEPLRTRINEFEAAVNTRFVEAEPDFEGWLSTATARPNPPLPDGRLLHVSLDEQAETVVNLVDSVAVGTLKEAPEVAPGKFAYALKFDGSNHVDLGLAADFEHDDAFSYGAWVEHPAVEKTGAILAKMSPEEDGARGYDLYMEKNKVLVHLEHTWRENWIRVRTRNQVPEGWNHLMMTYDGSGKAEGVRIYVNGAAVETEILADNLSGTIRTTHPLKIGLRGDKWGFGGGRVDEVQVYNRTLMPEEVARVAAYDPVDDWLTTPAGRRTPEQRALLYAQYLFHHDAPYRSTLAALNRVRAEEKTLTETRLETMVMQDLDTLRQAYVLLRGAYDAHGEPVEPGTPERILAFPDSLPKNRLGLAQWLVHPDNPLTARVIVNRYWQQYFGKGLVRTAEDFGSQGALPTHPQLLDWLATEFVRSGWDVKAMQKLIVTSATYRQAAAVSPELLQRDPQNEWLARGPRVRLSAEMIRDQALALSGLLVRDVGGPSVKPYQPAGLWEETTSGQGLIRYQQDHGDDLYRRSMYTFIKRTVPPPSMITFDATDRNACTVRRRQTSTPLQALVLLNDPQIVEAARIFAERMMAQGGMEPKERIAFAFRAATARPPTRQELAQLVGLFEDEWADFSNAPERALDLLSTGERPRDPSLDPAEVAAYTMVASTIFNLDEVITNG